MNRTKGNIPRMFYKIFGFLLIILIIGGLQMCDKAPSPNREYIDEVEDWAGYEACCDMTWFEMCDAYKKNKSVEFECFT